MSASEESGGVTAGDPGRGLTARPFAGDRREEDAARQADRVRWARRPKFQWPIAVVLSGLLVSLIIVATDHFRRGSVLFAGFVVLAFVLRAVRTDGDAGWLAVRSKPVDLLFLGVLGLLVTVFAFIVPSPS